MVERGCGVGRNIEPVLRLATASSAVASTVSVMVALMKVRAVRVWDRAQIRAWTWDPHWVWVQLAGTPGGHVLRFGGGISVGVGGAL